MKNQNILLVMVFSTAIYLCNGQATTAPSNTWAGFPNEYLGWDNTSNTSLRVKHALNYPINFYTQAGNTTFNNQRMTIYEDPANAAAANAGYVGIAKIIPSFQLCVGSHISIDTVIVYPTIANNQIGCYMIADTTVLHTNGVRCVATGFGAGLSLKSGTHDNVYNGWNAGRLDTNYFNTFIGAYAGAVNVGGSNNAFVGYNAGLVNTSGGNNTFVGANSGSANTTATQNSFFGSNAGLNNTTGSINVFMGAAAGGLNTTGSQNVQIGQNAGLNNQTGSNRTFVGLRAGESDTVSNNTFVGWQSGISNQSGTGNVFLGYRSGNATIRDDGNTFIGYETGQATNGGFYNSFLGYQAGFNNTTADSNTFLGCVSGRANTTGSNNTFTGFRSGTSNTAGIRNTAIGSESGLSNVTANDNTFVGNRSGRVNTVSGNTFIGSDAALVNTTGAGHVFVGYHSGLATVTDTNNTFVGYETGASNNGGMSNSFIGYRAGYSNSTADSNTFVGALAGFTNNTGSNNSFSGFKAGTSNSSGVKNTAFGSFAGAANTGSANSTFVGYQSGVVSTGGNNTMVGSNSGLRNTTGQRNSFVGQGSGNQIVAGDSNTYIGYQSGPSVAGSSGISNSSAVGANADVRNRDQMILGDNNVNVGIGLSGDATGPQNKLEINANGPYDPFLPLSGLRFTDMRSGSSTTTNPNHVVLSVNSTGDVILVPDDGGGNLTECGGGLTINYINKTTAAHTICNSDIFETTGSGAGTNLVGIGVGSALIPPTSPAAKLDILNDIPLTGTSIGEYVWSKAGTTSTHAYGIKAEATSFQGYAIGVQVIATPVGVTSAAHGVDITVNSSSNASLGNYGIYSTVSGTGTGVGYKSIVTGIAGTSVGTAPSSGADITVSTGTEIIGAYLESVNAKYENTGVRTYCHTNTTEATSYNKGFEAKDMNGGREIDGFVCGISNSNYTPSSSSDAQNNIGFKGTVGGSQNFQNNYGGQFVVGSGGNYSNVTNYGLSADLSSSSGTSLNNYGVYVTSWNATSDNVGLSGVAWNGSNISNNCYGVMGQAGGYYYNTTTKSYGGYFTAASGTNINYGVTGYGGGAPGSILSNSNLGGNFYSDGSNSNNYGVYSVTTTSGCGSTGTVTTTSSPCVSAAGYFVGAVLSTYGYFVPSDMNLKTNVTNIQDPLATINLLHPKMYQYDTTQFSNMDLSSGAQYGLLAQDVVNTMPQFVRHLRQPEQVDTLGNITHPKVDYLAINYHPFISLLIAGMQAQQQQIDSLTAIVGLLNNPLLPKNQNNSTPDKTGTIEVELNNVSKIIQLFQNDPNPFKEQTTITYYIPENVGAASIWFIDNNGTVLKKVAINERGEGSMIVMGSNLTSGTYSYNLIADGKIIDVKKMVKVK